MKPNGCVCVCVCVCLLQSVREDELKPMENQAKQQKEKNQELERKIRALQEHLNLSRLDDMMSTLEDANKVCVCVCVCVCVFSNFVMHFMSCICACKCVCEWMRLSSLSLSPLSLSLSLYSLSLSPSLLHTNTHTHTHTHISAAGFAGLLSALTSTHTHMLYFTGVAGAKQITGAF